MQHARRSSSPSPAPTTSSGPAASTGPGNAAAQAELAELAGKEPDHPVLHALGEAFGLGAGFVVTELLALLPAWSAPLTDESGAPVQSVPGATRIGDHDLEKRHTEVVGPQIAAAAAKLQPGALKDLLAGVGEGATEAPGASYRLETAVSDHLSRTFGGE